MLARMFFCVVVALTSASAAVAGSFEDGIEAYERGDLAMAYKKWAVMYRYGEGVPKNTFRLWKRWSD